MKNPAAQRVALAMPTRSRSYLDSRPVSHQMRHVTSRHVTRCVPVRGHVLASATTRHTYHLEDLSQKQGKILRGVLDACTAKCARRLFDASLATQGNATRGAFCVKQAFVSSSTAAFPSRGPFSSRLNRTMPSAHSPGISSLSLLTFNCLFVRAGFALLLTLLGLLMSNPTPHRIVTGYNCWGSSACHRTPHPPLRLHSI